MLTAAAGCAKLEALTPLGAMSDDQLKAFLAAVEADAGLQDQLKAAGDADAVVAIAKAAGFVISAEEIGFVIWRAQAEISEEELESVAGGGQLRFSNSHTQCGTPGCCFLFSTC